MQKWRLPLSMNVCLTRIFPGFLHGLATYLEDFPGFFHGMLISAADNLAQQRSRKTICLQKHEL